MTFSFTNKFVLVTGASRGIGKATALKFAESGATVIVHYHKNVEMAQEVQESLSGSGHFIVKADLSDPSSLRDMVDTIMQKSGRIDILVNNAGIYEEVDFVRMTYDEWKVAWNRTIDTNLTGVANLSFLVANIMIEIGSGKIINVSSRGAFRGEPTAFAYGASKAGLNALGQSMAKALAPYHVFVYTVAPGWVNTDMASDGLSGPEGKAIKAQSPLNRIARPEEIAQTIVYLAAEGNDYMTGCVVDINGASYLRT